MSIASEITRLQGVKADILGAIAAKKVDVPQGSALADVPGLIGQIPSWTQVKIGENVYPVAKIGNQLWLAKNLDENLGTLGVDEWYYNNDEAAAKANSYGRLYTWDNVNDHLADKLAQWGVAGWRWPTKADFDALVALDPTGKKLRIPSFYGGTDDYGLSLIGSGFYDGTFNGISSQSRIWSYTDDLSGNAKNLACDYNGLNIWDASKLSGRSIRLVMDLNADGTIPGFGMPTGPINAPAMLSSPAPDTPEPAPEPTEQEPEQLNG